MIVVALATALLAPGVAGAHAGHAHKIMGTVTSVRENQLDIKATDGKMSNVALNQKTKILRGKATVKWNDIKPGERVVVTAMDTKGKDGNTTMVSTDVRLGITAPSARK